MTTLNKRRHITIMGAEFRFLASREELFFGLADCWVTNQERVRISDPERTIIDGLQKPLYVLSPSCPPGGKFCCYDASRKGKLTEPNSSGFMTAS